MTVSPRFPMYTPLSRMTDRLSIDELGLRFNDYWGDSYPSETSYRMVSPLIFNVADETTDPRASYLPNNNGTTSELFGMDADYVYLIALIVVLPLAAVIIVPITKMFRKRQTK